ncbi:hypothetical protein B0A78_09465 [Flavobacterium columnare NBRC 100251 = ATCC 23463]|uniref:Lipoprotein n=1 Tax=Flavobacterium columnare TaxID=996 RepID=A0AAI8GB02_9FLAO|nr:hypothetical protein [Flavobacterium columnare]AMO19960.1 hypothetical protein UN65_05970 [Flavobacterium columnare]ANO48537.1 hypothetical protein Pf1_00289 [Flavobacterium columnare]APT23412.1 hypothetical protein BU993_12735 [Flavobacterium columnare]AUX17902.1 hypothetical protein AQ623_06090 [Flavobacterium columnare]MBF6655756.1 hypothetical protein [Flavobacterium columnare]
MKNFWFLLTSLMLLTACDDGNIIEETFNFGNITVQKCNTTNTLYKINDKEALVFVTPETSFPNEEGTKTYTIGTTHSLVYKKFYSTISSNEICSTGSVPIAEQWTVSGGTIEITSNKITSTNDPSKIVGYNHKILFKNITFNTPNKQLVYDQYDFGNYTTDLIDLKFDYKNAVMQNCSGNNLIFKYNNNNALLLDIDSNLYKHQTVGTKTALINNVNKISYRVYNGNLNSNFFCQSIPPTSPSLTEEWIAQNGTTDNDGVIVIETTQQTSTTYRHVIKLRKVTFKNGIKTYSPNPNGDYEFGEIIN